MASIPRVNGVILTAVLPTTDDECNLKCPFCIIKQRGEGVTAPRVNYRYYEKIVLAARDLPVPVVAFMLQGYEPLLDDWTFLYTYGLARRVADMGIKFIQVVTNGINLGKTLEGTPFGRRPTYARLLEKYVDKIIVSIDSADEKKHDRKRGVEGAFERTCEGVLEARKYFDAEDVRIASVFLPGKGKDLYGMPGLVHELGCDSLYVTPYINTRKPGQAVDLAHLHETMRYLVKEGERCGLRRVAISDEMGIYAPHLAPDIPVITTPTGKAILRFSPNGRCAHGKGLLLPSHMSPLYDTSDCSMPEFVERMFRRDGIEFACM
jgi:MoaA/NifB/PqqE/SkfB family radical SAM enzyme